MPIPTFAEFILRKLQKTNRNRFRFSRDQLKQMQLELSCTHEDLVYTLLDIFKERALPEISGFHVAAAAVGYSGDLYMGVNLETPFSALGHTVHAEQFVIVNAHMSKETGLSKFVVSDYPCGHCRQFMFELPDPHEIVVDVPSKGVTLRACNRKPRNFATRWFLVIAARVCGVRSRARRRMHASVLAAALPACGCAQRWTTSCRTALRWRRTPIGRSPRCLRSRQ